MTKQQSIYLKGWAVLFMMFLHFGGISNPDYRYSWYGNDYAGAFQICVPIFLFLSGYGLMVGCMNKDDSFVTSFKKQVRRTMKLFRHYWVVIAPFVALALLLGKFTWSWESFVLTATSLRCVWCPNAWFISLYVELILMFPLFFYFLKGKSKTRILLGFILLVIFTKLLGKIEWINAEGSILARQIKMLLLDMPIFIEGMLFAKYSWMNKLMGKMPDGHSSNLFGGAICVVAAIACRAKLPLISVTELIHVPMCLLGLMFLASCVAWLFSSISFVGKYSTTLWLIHGYFIWTFLAFFIYSFRFWPLAFIVFVGISLLVSIVVDKLTIPMWMARYADTA